MLTANTIITVEGIIDRERFEQAARAVVEPLWQNYMSEANDGVSVDIPSSVEFHYRPLDTPADKVGFATVACPRITVASTLTYSENFAPLGELHAAVRTAHKVGKQRKKIAQNIAGATDIHGMSARRVTMQLTLRSHNLDELDPPRT